ncbi:hypothetical protein ACGFNU_04020 [Spirillospora sp. NPDC048911]|uniref:hypothetical protein n=1 Tax=Spirillospora sp. NPDC048911 TaxID=3364527 RepID=UPI00371B2459
MGFPPSPSLLPVLEGVHTERLNYLRGLLVALTPEKRLAVVIVERDGFPVLNVVRVADSWSLFIECRYDHGEWWFGVPGCEAFARADQPATAAQKVKEGMRL